MTFTPPTSQPGITGSIPVFNRKNPPEGQMAAQIPIILTPANFQYANNFQLATGPFALSQVVTLIVDNTQNPNPIFVIHGVLLEYLAVPAYTEAVVPTFSGQGYYGLIVATGTNNVPIAPAASCGVNVILLNYERQTGLYATPPSVNIIGGTVNAEIVGNPTLNVNIQSSSVNLPVNVQGTVPISIAGVVNMNISSQTADFNVQVQNTIQNTEENSSVVYSNIVNPTGTGTTALVAAGPAGSSWVLDSLEVIVEALQSTAAGIAAVTIQLECGGVVFDSLYPVIFSPGSGDYITPAIGSFRTWPQGLLIPNNGPIVLILSGKVNMSSANIRINISGYNVPA